MRANLKVIVFAIWAGLLFSMRDNYTIAGNLVLWVGYLSIVIHQILQAIKNRNKSISASVASSKEERQK